VAHSLPKKRKKAVYPHPVTSKLFRLICALLVSDPTLSISSDIAARIIQEHAGEAPPTEAEISRVRAKIDLVLLPLLILIYALQYLDKVAYGLSANFGSLHDLQLETKLANGKSDLSRFRKGSFIFWTGCEHIDSQPSRAHYQYQSFRSSGWRVPFDFYRSASKA